MPQYVIYTLKKEWRRYVSGTHRLNPSVLHRCLAAKEYGPEGLVLKQDIMPLTWPVDEDALPEYTTKEPKPGTLLARLKAQSDRREEHERQSATQQGMDYNRNTGYLAHTEDQPTSPYIKLAEEVYREQPAKPKPGPRVIERTAEPDSFGVFGGPSARFP